MANRYISFCVFCLGASSSVALAAGDGSIKDLLWPTINFLVLAGFLIMKLKRPASAYFTRWSEEVAGLYEKAQEKAKEANLKYEMLKQKMDNFENEESKIMKDAQKQIQSFETQHHQQTVQKTQKIKTDAVAKVESQRNQLVRNLYSEVVQLVMSKAKQKINDDQNNKSKIGQRLVGQIGN